jgi:hypothetical protein
MTEFNSQLEVKIAAAEKARKEAHQTSLMTLLNNPQFIESQRQLSAKQRELRQLNTIMHQLNAVPAFIANDGSKYSITVYPISFFGHGLGEVLGIIASSSSAFTDDLMLQYSAITGISEIELSEAKQALGVPAYCTKGGIVMPAVEGNFTKLKALLASIALRMDIREFNLQDLNQDRYNLWFTRTELAAMKKAENYTLNATLDTAKFTMAD